MQSPFAMVEDEYSLPFINSQLSSRHRVKVFNDPIHGHFELSGVVLDAIDTPHFQRLRNLKQLGGTYFVYPGASHNRFEHSLGVAHLSNAFVHGLYHNKRDPVATSLYDNERQFKHSLQLVETAGLCHDLGHGPFSHFFDHQFLPRVMGGRKLGEMTHHEDRSVMLFEHMVDQFNLDFEREDIRHVGELIRGPEKGGGGLTPAFLYDVVANAKTGIDTDKFDYLARDVYNVGLQGAYGFDHRRLMKFAKVVGDSICFHRKEVFNVYHLFLTRFQLHRTVYNHAAALSIDAMLTDAFVAADSTLKISHSINDPEEFLTMTDCLIPIIERSKESSLASARKVVRRIRRRKLYRFVDEYLIPAGKSFKLTPEQISTCQDSATGVNLVPEDIHVAHVTLNFGMKDKNPVDKVLFFQDWEDVNPIHMPSSKASYVIPAHFQEKLIRIFVKREETNDTNENSRVKEAVKRAFRICLHEIGEDSPTVAPVISKRFRSFDSFGVPSSDQEEGLDGLVSTDTQRAHHTDSNVTTSLSERVAKRTKPSLGDDDGAVLS